MGIEFELKYRIGEAEMEALASAMGPGAVLEMETTYYDTPDGTLSSRRWTLRRRYESGKSVCTLKTPAGASARQEWEVEAPAVEGAIPELCKLGGPEELKELTASGLISICGARFRRQYWTESFREAVVELALDRGVLLGGGREQPLCELEVELKSGSPEAAVAYARILAEKYGLEPEEKSKFRRALDLAKEEM